MKKVIAISKDKIVVAEVNPTAKSKIGQAYEFGWKEETLDLVFAEIIKKFKTKSFRILVSDELSYVVRLIVPADVAREKVRDYIWDEIASKIPEELSGAQWDYKEVDSEKDDKTDKAKDVIIFALVKSFYQILGKAVKNVNMSVEAIEPEAIAKTRDVNPLVGIALKEDTTGRDENVLNLKLTMTEDEANKIKEGVNEIELENVKESSKTKSTVIIFLIVVILVLIGVGGYFIYKSFLGEKTPDNNKLSTEVAVTIPADEGGENLTPTMTSKSVSDLTGYALQVQNGSGVAGEAASVADTLKFEGFEQIDTTNASSSGFVKTEVRVKKGAPDFLFEVINKALNSDYDMSLSDDNLEDSSAYDAIIIVGKRLSGG
jgi:hypothetical protein